MSIEAYWYSSYSADGEPPRMRRLSRKPMDRQWKAAIDIAVAFAAGEAGYRPIGGNSITGEEIWLWPQPDGEWWMIPGRVSRRVFALNKAACEHEVRRGQGRAPQTGIIARLERWRETGSWRKIAAAVYPRHGTPSSFANLDATPKRRRKLQRTENGR
jgi:hypothetical protein